MIKCPLILANLRCVFQDIKCRTDRYFNSFFPDAILVWNNIISNYEYLPTLRILKSHLISLISLDNRNHFNALMYANDLISLSTSKEGLQTNLNFLNHYCEKCKLDINYVKTKCMIFTNGSLKENHNFTLNSQTIENVKGYKYLGITIDSKN